MTFLAKFNPDTQSYCARFPQQCFTGDAPTLSQINSLYGRDIAESWLDIQLSNLIEFTGVKGKDDLNDMIDSVLQVILDNFWFLKVSELMLFFQQFKAGKYGRFYGTVDPMVITQSIQEFCVYREEQLRKIVQNENQKARRIEDANRSRMMHSGILLTAEEWNEIKWLFNMGY